MEADATTLLIQGRDKKANVLQQRRAWAILRLAKEYLIDFNIRNAAARAEMDVGQAKLYEKEDLFITTVQELIEAIDPEVVITRSEVLMALKREAFNTSVEATPMSRIAALRELAKLTGMELPTKHELNLNAPIINLTLHASTPQPKRVSDVVVVKDVN